MRHFHEKLHGVQRRLFVLHLLLELEIDVAALTGLV